MTAHSSLGASSSHRWWMCPGSVRMAARHEDRETEFAREGSAAHAVASHCLQHGFFADRFLGWSVDLAAHDGPARFVEGEHPDLIPVNEEMVESVQTYLDVCRASVTPGVEHEIEHRFNLDQFYPGMFGTADFVAYDPERLHMTVVDFKYGRGVPVEVERNPQLLYYALGASVAKSNRGLATVEIAIVQPRCPHPDGPVRRWWIDVVDLVEWTNDLIEAAKRTEAPDAPLVPGEWCRFCPASGDCTAQDAAAFALAQAEFSPTGEIEMPDPKTFAPATLAEKLTAVGFVEEWCRRVREFAHHEAEAGRCPPGWKLVATRPTRRWKDPEATVEYLGVYGLASDEIYLEPKLRSPAQLEKVLGSKRKKDIAHLIEKTSSGTVLAPVADSREPVRPEAEKEFDVVETSDAAE